jgi:choline dehydrogenase-like flavoprotein
MATTATAVVDQNLRLLACDNLYACDNSVFPSSPAANPPWPCGSHDTPLTGNPEREAES